MSKSQTEEDVGCNARGLSVRLIARWAYRTTVKRDTGAQEDYLWQVIEHRHGAQLGIIEDCYLTIKADGAIFF